MTIKGLKAEVQNLEAELKSAAHRLRHVERELLASQIDLRPGDDRAGAPEPITDQVAQAALDATLRAEGEWELDVTEPGLGGAHGADRINVYISGSDGLQWPDANMKKDGANPYEKNGDFAWCGAFAAYCWATLKPSIRKSTFPSTYRLWRDWQSRRIPASNMRAGDIVVVWNDSATAEDREKKPYGQHITICRQPGADSYTTWEGNARATGPDGRYREGVGTRERELSNVAVVYRPQASDLA
ncbi:MAG: hypothetical protein ACO4AM_05660 [Candidatus Nanopelagicaceae bacterium]